jgi:hypothetical protein
MIDNCVIIEPRVTNDLIIVINNIYEKIPNSFVTLFCGNLNYLFITNNFSSYINSKLFLNNLEVDNLTVEEYNDIITSKQFWNNIKGEHILIFQIDSLVCNYDNDFIKECCKYGFVGAPVNKWDIPWQNGGLSLRKKSLMIKALENKKKYESLWPEDRYFSLLKNDITNPAPYNIANKFSVEKFYYDKPFGIHKCWKYLSNKDYKKLINKNLVLNLIKK